MLALCIFSFSFFFVYFLCYVLLIVPIIVVLIWLGVRSVGGLVGKGGVGVALRVFRVLLLMVSGFPPFVGFYVKLYRLFMFGLFRSVVVAFVYLVFAVISLSYYLNLVFIFFLFTSLLVEV